MKVKEIFGHEGVDEHRSNATIRDLEEKSSPFFASSRIYYFVH
jgi:hypothetical protein